MAGIVGTHLVAQVGFVVKGMINWNGCIWAFFMTNKPAI